MSRTLQMVLFLAVSTSILVGLHFYMYLRLVRDVGLPPHFRWAATAFLGVALISMPITMMVSRFLSPQVAKWVTLGPYYWMAIFFLICVLLLAGDLIRLVWFGASKGGLMPAWLDTDGAALWLRRGIAACSVLVTAVLVVFGALHQAKGPRTVSHQVVLPKMQPELEGFRLVQLSDLHIGPTLDGAWLQNVVDQANQQNPDVVLITGDLVDGTPALLGPQIQPLLALKARFGVFFVTGNHEYYSGAPEWIEFLGKMGIRVLRNQNVTLQVGAASLCIAGVNDYQAASMIPGETSDPAAAVQGCPKDVPIVMMGHDPRTLNGAQQAGVDLLLAGHTHGGQLWPWTWLVRLQQKHRVGFFQVGRTQLYVSPGTGYWGPPLRIGTTSEVTLLQLRTAAP